MIQTPKKDYPVFYGHLCRRVSSKVLLKEDLYLTGDSPQLYRGDILEVSSHEDIIFVKIKFDCQLLKFGEKFKRFELKIS